MFLLSFFSSYAGMYLVQTVLHSAVAAALADGSILAWGIRDPVLKQRLRLVVIIVPIFAFPLYQAADPSRGSLQFRLDAIFDSSRWLGLEVLGTLPAGVFVAVAFSAASLIFLLQEIIPIARHTFEPGGSGRGKKAPSSGPFLNGALEGLPEDKPSVVIVEDDDLLLYSHTGRDPHVVLSTGLRAALSDEELRAAIAHEIAHIERSRRPVLLAAFLLRVVMFYNPVTLVEFRKVVEEEEKICDDIAVSMTGDPGALAGAIEALRQPSPAKKTWAISTIEHSSHDILLRSRIMRLKDARGRAAEDGWLPLAATIAVTLWLNYYIV